jgi:hypothetical protein
MLLQTFQSVEVSDHYLLYHKFIILFNEVTNYCCCNMNPFYFHNFSAHHPSINAAVKLLRQGMLPL